jgi:hypothetical protein
MQPREAASLQVRPPRDSRLQPPFAHAKIFGAGQSKATFQSKRCPFSKKIEKFSKFFLRSILPFATRSTGHALNHFFLSLRKIFLQQQGFTKYLFSTSHATSIADGAAKKSRHSILLMPPSIHAESEDAIAHTNRFLSSVMHANEPFSLRESGAVPTFHGESYLLAI